MSRKVVRMTLDHLAELEAPCRTCVFWELDPVRRQRVDEPAAEKEAWMSAVLRDWGSCGRVVLVDDRAGRLRALRAAGVPARRRCLPDLAGLDRRRPALRGVRRARRPRRRTSAAGDGLVTPPRIKTERGGVGTGLWRNRADAHPCPSDRARCQKADPALEPRGRGRVRPGNDPVASAPWPATLPIPTRWPG